MWSLLGAAAREIADVQHQSAFAGARARLSKTPYDYLVTNLRLGAFNGLHLVYLATSHGLPVRCIVYTHERDVALVREIQNAGAFYETRECLPTTLAAYLRGTLPARDRRAPVAFDRRRVFRGGRRCWDQHLARPSH
jgi:DNA-binding NtrC family response regulator